MKSSEEGSSQRNERVPSYKESYGRGRVPQASEFRGLNNERKEESKRPIWGL